MREIGVILFFIYTFVFCNTHKDSANLQGTSLKGAVIKEINNKFYQLQEADVLQIEIKLGKYFINLADIFMTVKY